MTTASLIHMIVLALAAGGIEPEFLVAPLERPPDAFGQGPYVDLTAAVTLSPDFKDITGETLVGEAGVLTYAATSTESAAHFVATTGLQWAPAPSHIAGGVHVEIDALGLNDGDHTEFIINSSLRSPQPLGSQLNIPRFVLTQDALVRVIYEIDSRIEGAVQGHSASFIFRHGDAIGFPSIIYYDEAPAFGIDHYTSQRQLLFELEAGPYDCAAHLAYQGTMIAGIEPVSRVDASVKFRFDIVDQPQFYDCVTGPNQSSIAPCEPSDQDNDGDVDLNDFAITQQSAR